MPFQAWSPRSPTRGGNSGPVFGVGRQLFVDCPGGREDRAPLHDEKGAVVGSLIDGTEVEVVAWMPRGTGTRYLVRATRVDRSGWIGAANLRSTRVSRPAEEAMKAAPAAVWAQAQPTTTSLKRTPRRASRKTTQIGQQ
jgi:hypothetical protein